MLIQNVDGLSEHEIARACPSVFATSPHESRSGHYRQISTGTILTALHTEGFVPTTAAQSYARSAGRALFTKHLLRLRRVDDLGREKPNVHEIVLVNSSDGTSAYQLYGGIFRVACINNLIVGDIDSQMRVRHCGRIVDHVVESTLTLAHESDAVMGQVEEMKGRVLSRAEQLYLAEYALRLRFGAPAEKDGQQQVCPYQPADLLRVRRVEDYQEDLYTVLNRVQENCLRGGIARRDAEGHRHTIRATKSIDQNVRINCALWQFARSVLELKQAAAV